ncbi:MAG: hypothetical protein GKR88_09445 [Flavobacteriaceae bacterium]|nr:MAG: hypothetical protein GKR88_09445 [Flavobacteriaceae bacterium]
MKTIRLNDKNQTTGTIEKTTEEFHRAMSNRTKAWIVIENYINYKF